MYSTKAKNISMFELINARALVNSDYFIIFSGIANLQYRRGFSCSYPIAN